MSDAMAERGEPPVDSGLLGSRFETKYLVSRASAAGLRAKIGARLASHHHSVPPGMVVSDAHAHVTTTVYLDTPRRDLCRAATRSSVHLKVRVRMYRDDPAPLTAPEPAVWVELKERDGQRSGKRRCSLDQATASRWLSALSLHDDEAAGLACELLIESAADPLHRALMSELARTRVVLGAPLLPSCVVRYRREAFQDAAGMLRVTLDHDVRAYRAPASLLGALADEALGEPMHQEPVCVVEAKSLGAAPAWLSELLDSHGARALDYSKLVMASRAVHGSL